ncbi:MAG: hypothetical protein KDB73_20010, partial [Planctomycetes bacterium]|nr:hypothetical protein [Planctomycetota bacterium]
MGRHNGTWSPIYGQVWTHPKTSRAADHARLAMRGVRADVAPFLVVGWLNRVCLWCLANGETGHTGTLSDARMAALAWPEALESGARAARVGAVVRGSLRAGGFLTGVGADERVHDFLDHHARLLKERRRKRNYDDARDAGEEDASEPEARAEDSAEGSAERPAESSAEPGAEARAEPSARTDTDTDTDTDISPPSPPAGGGARASHAPSESELAAKLAARLGSSLRVCRKQVDALRDAGWTPARIADAIAAQAEAGLPPWDWTRRVLQAGAERQRRRAPRCAHCSSDAVAGPGLPAEHLPLGLDHDLCPGHLTAWLEARDRADRAAQTTRPLIPFQRPSGHGSPDFRATE